VKRIAAAAAFALCASCGGAALHGESVGPNVALHVQAELKAPAARLTVEIENRADDAISLDVDAIRLRDAGGEKYAPLGAPQRFRRANGETTERRVPHGALTVPPGSKKTVELEFNELPAEPGALSLWVPELYRLGIAGQIGLRAVKVALKGGGGGVPAPAAAAPSTGGVDGGFYDPFAQ
jgi:hypothetical protein